MREDRENIQTERERRKNPWQEGARNKKKRKEKVVKELFKERKKQRKGK